MADDGNSDGGQADGAAGYDPSQPVSVLGNAGFNPSWSVAGSATSGSASPAPSVLGGIDPNQTRSPADNSLNFFVDPDTMKTIDFGRTDQPQPPQPDGGGFYTGLTPWQSGNPNGNPKGDPTQGLAASQPVPQSSSSILDYDGATHQLTLTKGDGTIQVFPANNNVDSHSHSHSHSQGRWPNGVFDYDRHHAHPDDLSESAYGSYGGYGFNVPGRTNMEVHSGRETSPDGLERTSVDHATNGCIRTTDDGVAAIGDANAGSYPVTSITVRNNN